MHKKLIAGNSNSSRRIDRRLAVWTRMQPLQAAQIHSTIRADAKAER